MCVYHSVVIILYRVIGVTIVQSVVEKIERERGTRANQPHNTSPRIRVEHVSSLIVIHRVLLLIIILSPKWSFLEGVNTT